MAAQCEWLHWASFITVPSTMPLQMRLHLPSCRTAASRDWPPPQVMNAALIGAEAGEEKGYDIPSPSVSVRIRLGMELVDRNRDKSVDEIAYILYQHIGASMKSYESIPFSLGIFYAADGDYQTGLLTAINIGDDADTNGAIVGALCGAYCGVENIKATWIQKLRETNSMDFLSIASQLVSSHR